MSIDSVVSIAWDVLKWAGGPIKRHFGYVIYSKRYAQDLQKEVEELADEVDRVHSLVEAARNNLRNVYGRVTEWHASAEKALKEAADLLRDFQEASKTCCYETLPDPKCRYQFSRKAKDKIEVIQRLTQKCREFKEFNDISSRNPASGNVAALTSVKREGISSSNPAPGNIAALPPAKREGISSSNPAPGNIAALTPAKREGISSSNPAPGNVAALTPAKREGKDVVQSATVTASPSFASTLNKVGDNGVFESRASIIRDIMDALADDSNSVVGVHGMGGVGKSTLLADVERRIMEEKSFDWVTKADVSENPDIKKIQGEIADALALTEIKDKETTSGRAKLLLERLENEERKKKKVLIILDNLWKGLDLKSVGIPCGHDNKVIGCKLLLTSRFQDVLQREMGCDGDFRLEQLKDEEAKRLFERTVGDKVHDDPFNSLVDEAVQKCAGLPFLIIAMANIFKHADFPEWKDVLRQIEKSTNRGISERINEMLQLSYDRFKGEDGKEVKLLLRLCVVYGVPKPSLENLVRYSVGSRLFREDNSMEEVRDRMSSLVQTLKASSLLLKDDEDVDGFKIHDLVRGFVASVASRDDPLLVLKDNDKSVLELPKDKLKSCTAICFAYVNMKELPKELDCPEMRIFLLFTNNESLKVPNSYFNSMKKLMVLHLSQVCLSHSPLPFQFLENLHTLCLDGCSLDDVAMIGELKGLHILSFVNSKIQRLPKEIGQLVELRLLDLNHCSRLQIIEPGVLGSLMKLEELYMENSFNRWNAVKQTPPTNAKLIELNNLKNLYTLHVSILDPSSLPEDLDVEKLTKYKIQIGDPWKWPKHKGSSTSQVKFDLISNFFQKIQIDDAWKWPKHKGSSTLQVKLDPISNILQKGFMQTFLGKTNYLFLDGSNGIEQSICKLSQEGFPKLKHLRVENSPSIHYVLQSHTHTDFKTLESLLLKNLINLEKICNYSISSQSFSALKVIRVESCNKMEILFPLSLLRELPQLEEVQAIKCNLVQEIVEVDDCGKVALRNLHVLELRDLPNTKNFFTTRTVPSSTSNDQVGTLVAFFNEQHVTFY
ncbi:disease resistance protein At4g27190-like [Eucalyptus grandis]|uniref:disease resistance protein At4g27190-like n=1 Tax=Eucalyptus grandis TaxID=71139 RepID=UPI00192EAB53|nr:disease resistance protein At4g27190-like [Eucalyptus grandis]